METPYLPPENDSALFPPHSGDCPFKVLVVDDDPGVRNFLQSLLASMNLPAQTTQSASQAIDMVRENFFHVVVLDVYMPEKSGLDLLPEIRQASPLSRVIMMSGYADKSAAISALRGGALDFLEKPLSRELFVHSVNRALEVLEKDLELRRARNELERTNLELRHQKSALEQMKLQLIETNEALSVLARNLDTARVESERRTALMAKSLLLPIVQRLRNNAALAGCDGDLELLSQHIRDLTANVGQDNKIITTLSRSELRVAALVRNGMTNEEIAEHLNVSTFTVKTHRRNIRKKLKLNNAHVNLRSYLANHLAEEKARKG